MRYTTFDHALQRCNLLRDGSSAAIDDVTKDEIFRMIDGVSDRMSKCMNRDIQVIERVETLCPTNGRCLFPDNPLIRSVSKIEYDPTGIFAPGAAVLTNGTDFSVDPDQMRINMIMRWPMPYKPPTKPLRVTYMGGQAYHTWKTVYALASSSGAPATGTWPQEDGSIIIIDAIDTVNGRVTFRPSRGSYDTSDVITCSSDATPATITLGDCLEDSVINNISALEGACLMQVQYEFERRLSVGKRSTTSGPGQTQYIGEYGLLKEVSERCDAYQLYSMALT